MKKFILEYVAFNIWANDRICKAASLLHDEQFTQIIKSSFPTIRETLIHMWEAQDIWMERIEGRSPVTWPLAAFNGNKEDLISGLMKSSTLLQAKARACSKKKLKVEVAYTTLKGISGVSSLYQIFAHVVNHGTYHRGQLVTMFRNAGVTEIPATDLIAFFREQPKKKSK